VGFVAVEGGVLFLAGRDLVTPGNLVSGITRRSAIVAVFVATKSI